MVVVWSVVALRAPQTDRRCPRCAAQRWFVSSDNFRINAQKRRLDVWLVHRCEACDFTWNMTVLERVRPEDIEPARYERFLRNDAGEAWWWAFRGPGDRRVPWRAEVTGSGTDVVVRLVHPVELRLDRLVAGVLGVPRAAAARYVEVDPAELRRRVRDGQPVRLATPAPSLALYGGRASGPER